jgi:23S rRNA pseudouridine1911/1915/1917 synthase
MRSDVPPSHGHAAGSEAWARRLDMPVAFASAHEIVVVKPEGMAVELTRDPRGESLIARVRAAAGPGANPRLPHRLDRVTRGFVVVALTDSAAAWHGGALERGEWTKVYLARVRPQRGIDPTTLVGEHKVYLRQRDMRAEVVRAGGKPSRLVVEGAWPAPGRDDQWHMVVRLLTGRFHQVRVMLAHLGAPLVGDALYGGDPGRMCLEHAGLRFVPTEAEHAATVFDARDPEREPVDPGALGAIARCITGG